MSRGTVKCLVWDLDNTLWDGVLLEGDDVRLRSSVETTLRTLDERGVLLSIASRSDPATAEAKLRELGVEELFVFPQISWGAKSSAVMHIADRLNISTDALAFVDDDPFERDEVASRVPGILCLDAADIPTMLDRGEFRPRFVTEDSRRRRSMVQADITRSLDERDVAPREFLASLQMILTLSGAAPGDLARVEELTVRTNQLNSTGYTYSYEQLELLRRSKKHRLLVAGLDDRYGTYGKVGLAVVELHEDVRLVRLMLVSCRVMARGVGPMMLTYILEESAAEGKPVRAEFIRTERNRPMYLMFKMAGFKTVERRGDLVLLEHNANDVPARLPYVQVRVEVPER